MKRILLLFCALFLCLYSNAQYNLKQNNVWAFGNYAGLDFNTGSPVSIVTGINDGPDDDLEGTAAVCDSGGHLLFYCSGDTVWNRNNQMMPNGGGLIAPYEALSATQGALIVPVLSNPNQYYIFSLEEGSFGGLDIFAGRLFYCIVDMTLDGGLGDVVAGQKEIPVDSILSEKMIAVQGDNCDIWLLVHDNINNNFKAYDITSEGISDTPVISSIGSLVAEQSYDAGTIKISPDRRKLAYCSAPILVSGGTELFDFDPATGIVSNVVELDSFYISYGAAFSPDNSKLYCTGNTTNGTTTLSYLYQYDISLPNAAAIVNSRTMIDSGSNSGTAPYHYLLYTDLRLGPDGKIYMPSAAPFDSISQINSPNLAGAACNYVHNAFPLASGTTDMLGMGNIYVQPLQDTVHTSTDTSLSPVGNVTLQIPPGYFSYHWNDGTTDSGKVVTSPGTYWVTYNNYCTYRTDSFVVHRSTAVANINGQVAALTVYPCPAQTTITITINGISKVKGILRIIDAVGKTVLEQACSNNMQTINISDMASGAYTITYTDMTGAIKLQQRFVIAK